MPFAFTPLDEEGGGIFMQQSLLRSASRVMGPAGLGAPIAARGDRGAPAYIIYLVNRGYSFPHPRVVGLLSATKAAPAASGWRIIDRVSGRAVGVLSAGAPSAVQIAVECGCFRVLEMHAAS